MRGAPDSRTLHSPPHRGGENQNMRRGPWPRAYLHGAAALFLAILLLPGSVMAASPAWTARGGAPVAISADGGFVLSDGESFALYNSRGETVWRGFGGSSAMSLGEVTTRLALTRDGMYSVLDTNGGLLYVDRTQRVFWEDSQYRPIGDIALSPDDDFVASVADGRVSVYTRGGDLVWRNSTYRDVEFVGISPGRLLTVAASDEVLHAFNQTGFELWNETAPGISEVLVSPADSDIIVASDYTVLSFHPSGNLLWRFYTGDEIRDIAISEDGSTVAAGNQGGRLLLLDQNGRELWSFTVGNWANAVSLSGDGSLVAAGGIDRKVYLFDRSGRQLFNYTTGGIVQGVAVSSDGSALAAAADMVYYFDLRQPAPGETTPVPTPVTTTFPAPSPSAPVPTPSVPSETTTTPSPTLPAETTPRETAWGPAVLVAPGMVILWFALKRGE